MHTALRGYKDGWGGDDSDALRNRFTVGLAAVLTRFLEGHEERIARAAGTEGFDVVTTVPSGTPEREEVHWRLRWMPETGCRVTAPRYRRVLAPTPRAAKGKMYDPDRYEAAERLEEVGDMMILTGKTIVSALRPPHPYGGEFVSQFLFVLRLCWFPLLVSTVAFGYGAPGLQAANFLVLFGALDRLGGFFVLASIREFAPFVTAIVVSGVAGTAIIADLGARKIREELDALQVIGVDPVKNLVVPRFLALMLVTGLVDVYALLCGIFGDVIATVTNGAPLGPFWATFFTNASVTDLWGSVLKCTLTGAIIAIVCCYKGMTASGGAEGVGRAVNQGVVIALLASFAFNYVFTQTLLATHPEITVIR
jgi:phospholipid/cholesterol/gamma-HCH transport system permease protein